MTFFEAFYIYCNYCMPYVGAQKEVHKKLSEPLAYNYSNYYNYESEGGLPPEPYCIEDYATQSMFDPENVPPEPLIDILNDKGRELLLHVAQEYQCGDFLARIIRAGNAVTAEERLTL